MDWTIPLTAAVAPFVGKGIHWLIEKDLERENRQIAEWEAEQAEKRRIKAEKKAAKRGVYYTSATVVPPPRLGHGDSGSSRSDSGADRDA